MFYEEYLRDTYPDLFEEWNSLHEEEEFVALESFHRSFSPWWPFSDVTEPFNLEEYVLTMLSSGPTFSEWLATSQSWVVKQFTELDFNTATDVDTIIAKQLGFDKIYNSHRAIWRQTYGDSIEYLPFIGVVQTGLPGFHYAGRFRIPTLYDAGYLLRDHMIEFNETSATTDYDQFVTQGRPYVSQYGPNTDIDTIHYPDWANFYIRQALFVDFFPWLRKIMLEQSGGYLGIGPLAVLAQWVDANKPFDDVYFVNQASYMTRFQCLGMEFLGANYETHTGSETIAGNQLDPSQALRARWAFSSSEDGLNIAKLLHDIDFKFIIPTEPLHQGAEITEPVLDATWMVRGDVRGAKYAISWPFYCEPPTPQIEPVIPWIPTLRDGTPPGAAHSRNVEAASLNLLKGSGQPTQGFRIGEFLWDLGSAFRAATPTPPR